MNAIKPPRALVWATIIIILLVLGISLFLSRDELPPPVVISAKGQPTIGYPNARVHVIVFEEPKCVHCKIFNDEIFPKIKKEFIDTNKILYSTIIVSFLPNSMPAANALMGVYNANPMYPNPDLFFTYLDYMFDHQPRESSDWATPDRMLEFARDASPAINLDTLKTSLETDTFRIKIEQNNDYARKIMGGKISTPALYVNGIETKELSWDAVKKLIKEVLEQKGVY